MYGGDMPFGADMDPEMMAAMYGEGMPFGADFDPSDSFPPDYMDYLDSMGGMPPFGPDGMPFYPGMYGDIDPTDMPGAAQGFRGSTASDGTAKFESPAKIMKELKGKADSNPGYVREKLREIAKAKTESKR
jgi:hypothetical protein